MNKFYKLIILLFVSAFVSGWTHALCGSDQAWFQNTTTFTISSKLSLRLIQESRHLDITFSNPYLKNIQAGVSINLPKNFYFATIYRREYEDIEDHVSNENRFTLETGWKTRVAKELDFDLRFRTEIREFEESALEDHLRFRFRLRLKSKVSIGKLKLKPFIATETFGKDKIYTIQKNRLYIGTNFPLSEHVEFVLSYIWLATRGKESIHILYSGFDLKF